MAFGIPSFVIMSFGIMSFGIRSVYRASLRSLSLPLFHTIHIPDYGPNVLARRVRQEGPQMFWPPLPVLNLANTIYIRIGWKECKRQ